MSDLTGYDSSLFISSDYCQTTYEIGSVKQTLLCLKSATTDLDLTGQIVWPASQVLAWFIHQFRDLFKGKCVLELGSGCGLAGLVVGQLGASKVYLTDSSPVVLQMLEKTVKLELNQEGCEKRVCKLDWSQTETTEKLIEEFKQQGRFPDVVIGADVFQTSFGSPKLLFQTIKNITKSHPSKNMTFYVCFALRQTTKEELVKECAQEEGFVQEESVCMRKMLPAEHPPDSFSKEKLRLFKYTISL